MCFNFQNARRRLTRLRFLRGKIIRLFYNKYSYVRTEGRNVPVCNNPLGYDMKKALLTLTALSMSVAVSACSGHSDAPPPPPPMDHMAEGFFNRLDQNGDGVVTKSEYKTYTTRWFNEADTNHDGKLTLDEVKAKFRKDHGKHHHRHLDKVTANGSDNNAPPPPPPPFEPRPE